jgi:hypothetical protein
MIFPGTIPLGGLGSHKVGRVVEKKCGLKVKHRHTTWAMLTTRSNAIPSNSARQSVRRSLRRPCMRIWIFLLSLGQRSSNSASAERSQCVAAEQSKPTIGANNRRRLSARRAHQGRNNEEPVFAKSTAVPAMGRARCFRLAMPRSDMAPAAIASRRMSSSPGVPEWPILAKLGVLARALSDLRPFGIPTFFPSLVQARHRPSPAVLTVSA